MSSINNNENVRRQSPLDPNNKSEVSQDKLSSVDTQTKKIAPSFLEKVGEYFDNKTVWGLMANFSTAKEMKHFKASYDNLVKAFFSANPLAGFDPQKLKQEIKEETPFLFKTENELKKIQTDPAKITKINDMRGLHNLRIQLMKDMDEKMDSIMKIRKEGALGNTPIEVGIEKLKDLYRLEKEIESLKAQEFKALQDYLSSYDDAVQ